MIHGFSRFAAVLALSLACGTALAQTPQDAAAPSADKSAQPSIKLVGVIVALPVGAIWLSMEHSVFCDQVTTEVWTAGRAPQELPPYSSAFKAELERAGYKVVVPGDDNLFDPEAATAEYEAAAVITGERIDACESYGGALVASKYGDIKGSATMKIDWQIYSPIKKLVVARVSTSGNAKLENFITGGLPRLMMDSFTDNVRQLAAAPDFQTAMTAPKPLMGDLVVAGQEDKIVLPGSLKAKGQSVADAVGSVVTVITGDGSGSGVLVSDDGYILTNAHVVGDEKAVRVRWSDGIETVAQVVRVSKPRDVAIVKTSSRDRLPLPLKRGAVTPGQRVYAIGSPKGQTFAGTVSSGVVSASRILNGLNYIQSDVSVSPGSSGGALLDDKGSLIGLTVAGVDNEGRAGLNLFIPIGDVIDFLSLEQK
jgi:S1-C subfamily serine protease